MKTIKVKFCDGFYEEDLVFMPILKRHYNVIESDEPEYLFYSVFGQEHFKYSNCIKIFTTGEAIVPNFNECDYATSFDYMEFGDRYLRLPLCSIMFRNGKNVLDSAIERGSRLPAVEKKEFCSFVVSNGRGMPERKRMFELLNEYKTVNSGGRYMNNIGGPVENKQLFEHRHKFSICFENERYPGYTTEKIVDAFSAGVIPIYLGDPRICEYFNEKAFVNVCDFDSLEDAVEYIKRIDKDDELYRQIMAQPILKKDLPGLKELERFLCGIIDRDIEAAVRTPKGSMVRSAVYGEGNPYHGRVFNIWIKPYNLYRKAKEKLLTIKKGKK